MTVWMFFFFRKLFYKKKVVMKKLIKRFWQSPDRNWYLVLGVCGGYIIWHIIVGIILKLITL